VVLAKGREMYKELFLRGIEEDVNRFAWKISLFEHQVDDFTQEGLIGMERAYQRYKGNMSGLSLRKVMMRSATNAMRSWQRKVVSFNVCVGIENLDTMVVHSTHEADVEIKDMVDTALISFESRKKRMIRSYFSGERTMQELGTQYNVSRATISRCLTVFRSEISKLMGVEACLQT